MSKYIDRVLEECRQKNAGEPEFLQTVEEVLTSLAPVIDAHPEYEKASLLERMIEPCLLYTSPRRAAAHRGGQHRGGRETHLFAPEIPLQPGGLLFL